MVKSNSEAQKTLQALDRLIHVAEWMGVGDSPAKRAALQALRARQVVLRDLISARQELVQQKIVPLAAWREGEPGEEAAPTRRRLAAAAVLR
jgi:hypothetical protein